MSFLTKLYEAEAEMAARDADPWRLPWSVCAARRATMASSVLPHRRCSISLKFPSAVEEPGHVGVWRS